MDAFDSIFSGKDVKGSVRRKGGDGVSRSVSLTAAPAAFTLEAFAEAAMAGAAFSKRGEDRGASLSVSRTVSGAAAKSAVLALGDAAADPVPAAVKTRGRSVVAPETNGAAS